MLPAMRVPAVVLVLAAVLAGGCMRYDRVELAPGEQRLLAMLTRDKGVRLVQRQRAEDGGLDVTTHQGPETVRYRIEADGAGGHRLRREREGGWLEVAADGAR